MGSWGALGRAFPVGQGVILPLCPVRHSWGAVFRSGFLRRDKELLKGSSGWYGDNEGVGAFPSQGEAEGAGPG